jgi:hypothetical protein
MEQSLAKAYFPSYARVIFIDKMLKLVKIFAQRSSL